MNICYQKWQSLGVKELWALSDKLSHSFAHAMFFVLCYMHISFIHIVKWKVEYTPSSAANTHPNNGHEGNQGGYGYHHHVEYTPIWNSNTTLALCKPTQSFLYQATCLHT